MSVLDLPMLKEQFGGLMNRVTPGTESYFVMWLDIKVAEYKVLGHMRLQNKVEADAKKKSAANLSRGGEDGDDSGQYDGEDHPSWAKRQRRGRRRSVEEQEDLRKQDFCEIDEHLREIVAIIPASDSTQDMYSMMEHAPGGSRSTELPGHQPNRTTAKRNSSQIERSHVGPVFTYSSTVSSQLTLPRNIPQGFDKASHISPSPSIGISTMTQEETDSAGVSAKHDDEAQDADDDGFIIFKAPLHVHPVSLIVNQSVLMKDTQVVDSLPVALDYQASMSRPRNVPAIHVDYEQYPHADDIADVALGECSLTDEGDFDPQSQDQSEDSSSIAAPAQSEDLDEQVELVPGSGVYLPAQKYLMVKSMAHSKPESPKTAVTKLLGVFFDTKTLALSCAVGGHPNIHKDTRFGAERGIPLDATILATIKDASPQDIQPLVSVQVSRLRPTKESVMETASSASTIDPTTQTTSVASTTDSTILTASLASTAGLTTATVAAAVTTDPTFATVASSTSDPTTTTTAAASPIDPTIAIPAAASTEDLTTVTASASSTADSTVVTVSAVSTADPTVATASAVSTADPTTPIDGNLWCNDCQHEFTTLSNLHRHMRIHTDNMYACELCAKKFFTNYSLKSHVLTKHQEHTFPCEEEGCTKEYKTLGGLRLHQATHTNTERFICCHCGLRMSYKSTFDAHIAKHEGTKPFRCNKCQKCFGHASNLASHKHVCQNKSRTFQCQECPKAFKAIRYLKEHQRIHIEALVCSYCGKRFNTRGGLYAHNKRKHTS